MFRISKIQVDMGTESTGKALLKLAIPSVLSMFFHTLFHLIDTIFVSWLGEISLAAMSLSFPLLFVIFAIINGMAVGTTTCVTKELGANNTAKAQIFANASLLLILGLSLLPIPLLTSDLSNKFYFILGGKGAVLPECYAYSFWMILGAPLMGLALLGESLFRSQGDTFTPMMSMLIGNLLNILLDPILIFGLKWGIAGASIATFVGRIASLAYLAYKLKKKARLRPTLRFDKSFPKYWKDISIVGFPVALSQTSMAIGAALMNKILSLFGPAAISAWMLGNRIEMFAFLPVFGLNSGLIPFLSYNIGKGNFQRVKEAVMLASKAAVVLMLSIGLLLFSFPQIFLLPFSPTPQMASMAIDSVRASATGYIFAAIDITLWGLFQGSGYAYFGMISQLARTLLFRASLGYLMGIYFGIKIFWWCQPLSALGSLLLSLLFAKKVLNLIQENINSKA